MNLQAAAKRTVTGIEPQGSMPGWERMGLFDYFLNVLIKKILLRKKRYVTIASGNKGGVIKMAQPMVSDRGRPFGVCLYTPDYRAKRDNHIYYKNYV